MTKKEMISYCRREVIKAGGGACYRFHVYENMAHKERAAEIGNPDMLNDEAKSPWRDLYKWATHGRVIDVFMYDAPVARAGSVNCVLIELPAK